MRASDFDFELPESLIAQVPSASREGSRLLHVRAAHFADVMFRDVASLLRPDDALVLNDSRVFPGRLMGHKAATLGKVELLLVRPTDGSAAHAALELAPAATPWMCLAKPARSLKRGAVLEFRHGLEATVVASRLGGEVEVTFASPHPTLSAALHAAGRIPLPPYIARAPTDADVARYQTVYARDEGSIAAPTAGLHFTAEVLDGLRARGHLIHFVRLEVGPGTFLPVRDDTLAGNTLHPERVEISTEVADSLTRHLALGRRIVAVGTTVVRSLESAFVDGAVRAGAFDTQLFIKPGFHFYVVGALLTNFHLPRSTLLALACAFGGYHNVLAAYQHAIAAGYRFYSYGDAMFIEP